MEFDAFRTDRTGAGVLCRFLTYFRCICSQIAAAIVSGFVPLVTRTKSFPAAETIFLNSSECLCEHQGI